MTASPKNHGPAQAPLFNHNRPSFISDHFSYLIEKFNEDYGTLNRFYTAQTSANRSAKFSGAKPTRESISPTRVLIDPPLP